jgi:hypothetical protein
MHKSIERAIVVCGLQAASSPIDCVRLLLSCCRASAARRAVSVAAVVVAVAVVEVNFLFSVQVMVV